MIMYNYMAIYKLPVLRLLFCFRVASIHMGCQGVEMKFVTEDKLDREANNVTGIGFKNARKEFGDAHWCPTICLPTGEINKDMFTLLIRLIAWT